MLQHALQDFLMIIYQQSLKLQPQIGGVLIRLQAWSLHLLTVDSYNQHVVLITQLLFLIKQQLQLLEL